YNEDRSISVVFNGEIYNFCELRTELEARGHEFYTHTDTEVIVHLYEDFGLDFVKKLRGMFAIALYDQKGESLLLARDRLGKKPLYYALHKGRLYFASEISYSRDRTAPYGAGSRRDSAIFLFWIHLRPRFCVSPYSQTSTGPSRRIPARRDRRPPI